MSFSSINQKRALDAAAARERKSGPLFAARANATLNRARDTYSVRGAQYGDTWRDCQWLTLRAVSGRLFVGRLTDSECRRLAAAVLVDVKHQRMQGGYKDDNLIDGINYAALLAEEMRQP